MIEIKDTCIFFPGFHLNVLLNHPQYLNARDLPRLPWLQPQPPRYVTHPVTVCSLGSNSIKVFAFHPKKITLSCNDLQHRRPRQISMDSRGADPHRPPSVSTTKKMAKRSPKTYNSGDSLVVTHLTTNPPVSCLYMAERTGSLIFMILWSYVQDKASLGIIYSSQTSSPYIGGHVHYSYSMDHWRLSSTPRGQWSLSTNA